MKTTKRGGIGPLARIGGPRIGLRRGREWGKIVQQFDLVLRETLAALPLGKSDLRRLADGNDIRQVVFNFLRARVSGQFPNEVVPSTGGYPSGFQVQPERGFDLAGLLAEEKRRITRFLPELNEADYDLALVKEIEAGRVELPLGAERWTLLPSPWALNRDYNHAVNLVLVALRQALGNRFFGRLYGGNDAQTSCLQLVKRAGAAWRKLADGQSGRDLLVVPVQLGALHGGESAQRAEELFLRDEFGLGVYATGILFLTHPDRFSSPVLKEQQNILWPLCVGDRQGSSCHGGAPLVPYFDRHGQDGFENGCFERNFANGQYGAVSAFTF